MGKSSQKKGRAAELELCRLLQSHGIPAEPGSPLNYGTEPDIKGVAGLHVECKHCETWRLPDWLKQSEEDAARFGDGAPTVIFRRNRGRWYIALSLSDFLTFYQNQHT